MWRGVTRMQGLGPEPLNTQLREKWYEGPHCSFSPTRWGPDHLREGIKPSYGVLVIGHKPNSAASFEPTSVAKKTCRYRESETKKKLTNLVKLESLGLGKTRMLPPPGLRPLPGKLNDHLIVHLRRKNGPRSLLVRPSEVITLGMKSDASLKMARIREKTEKPCVCANSFLGVNSLWDGGGTEKTPVWTA